MLLTATLAPELIRCNRHALTRPLPLLSRLDDQARAMHGVEKDSLAESRQSEERLAGRLTKASDMATQLKTQLATEKEAARAAQVI